MILTNIGDYKQKLPSTVTADNINLVLFTLLPYLFNITIAMIFLNVIISYMNFSRSNQISTRPNLTPLIDVVFLLIIFFMVVSKFSTLERTKMDLPKADDAVTLDLPTEQNKVIINIEKTGQILVDNQQFTSNELSLLLKNYTSGKVIIRSDKACLWNQVRPVFEACRQAGIAAPDIAVKKDK